MPEMLRYFGKQFTVSAQVERACDMFHSGVVRMPKTVMLDDLRCDGSGHDGCQAQCRLYWKEAWLRPASSVAATNPLDDQSLMELARLTKANVHSATSTPDTPTFRCQATELMRGSERVRWYSPGSFVRELTGGNVGPVRWVWVMIGAVFQEIGLRLGLLSRAPFRPNQLAGNGSVAAAARGLRPGELVQIRSKEEIGGTLGETGKNRGLWFDREMVPYCGKTARVKTKVERFIDDGTGRMIELKSDCYILDGVVCNSYRSDKRWFCPRAIYPWWRESWLEPLDEEAAERPAETRAT
jgi:hypothetical protein